MTTTTTAINSAIIIAAIFAAASAISFDEGYTPLFGEQNIVRSPDGRKVKIILNQYSGSGFVSSALYYHGLFSASIKLPSDYTAGVVVAFYMSNGDIFEKNHDELDFEFLGNIKGKQWRVQTNVYGNGSTDRGREERYFLPFDPTAEAHRYSILWTNSTIIFYIDEIPIRELLRTEAMGGEFPSKPMSLYATIWDASNWATSGGKYRVNYNHAPFITEFSNFILMGCRRLDPIQQLPAAAAAAAEEECSVAGEMTAAKRASMRRFRRRYMSYGFCHDEIRYPKAFAFPECDNNVELEKDGFFINGYAKVSSAGRHRRWRRRRRDWSRSGISLKGHDEE